MPRLKFKIKVSRHKRIQSRCLDKSSWHTSYLQLCGKPPHVRWLDEGPTVRCSNLFSMHPHPHCCHMSVVSPEGLSECNSLPLAMMNWLYKSHWIQRRQNGKTKKKEKLGQRAYCRFEKQKTGNMEKNLACQHLLFLGATTSISP